MNDTVLAVAAGHTITEQELNNLIANYPPEQQVYFSNPNAKDELLEQLIGFHLFSALAEEQKIKESKAYRETLTKMEQELASHILVDSEEEAKKAAEEIAAGKAFSDAAREYSTCPSKEKGGDLGYFGKGQMAPEFERAAFGAQAGETVGPVQTQFGYHLIRVEDKKQEEGVRFSDIKEQLKEKLLQQKKQEVYLKTVKELEVKYGVERMR